MKTLKISVTLAAILMSGAIFHSCQKEQNPNPVNEQEIMLLKSGNCTTDCIDEFSGDSFADTYTQTVSWGGPNNDKFSKTGTLRVWNTLSSIIYEFSSTEPISDLIIVIDGVDVSTGLSAAANVPLLYSIVLPSDWESCDVITNSFKLAGNGPQIEFTNIVYALIGPCCETAFNGSTECGSWTVDGIEYNRKAMYMFTSEDAGSFKLQGGLTNFAGTDYLATATAGQVSSWVPGGSSNRIIKVEGEFPGDCEEVELTIYWYSTNADDYITGDWSVEFNGVKILEMDQLMCDDAGSGYAPMP